MSALIKREKKHTPRTNEIKVHWFIKQYFLPLAFVAVVSCCSNCFCLFANIRRPPHTHTHKLTRARTHIYRCLYGSFVWKKFAEKKIMLFSLVVREGICMYKFVHVCLSVAAQKHLALQFTLLLRYFIRLLFNYILTLVESKSNFVCLRCNLVDVAF